MPFHSFTPVHMGFAEGADALIAGEIDAQFQPPIPNKVMTDLSQRADVRVVPYAARQLEKILANVPFYRRATMAKNVFRGVIEDASQLGVVNVLVTHERVGENLVRDLAATIAQNLDALPAMNPLFQGLKALFEPLTSQGAAAFEFGGVGLHPGAALGAREAHVGFLRAPEPGSDAHRRRAARQAGSKAGGWIDASLLWRNYD
jgi:hypothetical protein